MYCAQCRIRSIDHDQEDFAGFLCGSGHMLCQECTRKMNGTCKICGDKQMRFVKMNTMVPVTIHLPSKKKHAQASHSKEKLVKNNTNARDAAAKETTEQIDTMAELKEKLNATLKNKLAKLSATANTKLIAKANGKTKLDVHKKPFDSVDTVLKLQEQLRNNAANILKLCASVQTSIMPQIQYQQMPIAASTSSRITLQAPTQTLSTVKVQAEEIRDPYILNSIEECIKTQNILLEQIFQLQAHNSNFNDAAAKLVSNWLESQDLNKILEKHFMEQLQSLELQQPTAPVYQSDSENTQISAEIAVDPLKLELNRLLQENQKLLLENTLLTAKIAEKKTGTKKDNSLNMKDIESTTILPLVEKKMSTASVHSMHKEISKENQKLLLENAILMAKMIECHADKAFQKAENDILQRQNIQLKSVAVSATSEISLKSTCTEDMQQSYPSSVADISMSSTHLANPASTSNMRHLCKCCKKHFNISKSCIEIKNSETVKMLFVGQNVNGKSDSGILQRKSTPNVKDASTITDASMKVSDLVIGNSSYSLNNYLELQSSQETNKVKLLPNQREVGTNTDGGYVHNRIITESEQCVLANYPEDSLLNNLQDYVIMHAEIKQSSQVPVEYFFKKSNKSTAKRIDLSMKKVLGTIHEKQRPYIKKSKRHRIIDSLEIMRKPIEQAPIIKNYFHPSGIFLDRSSYILNKNLPPDYSRSAYKRKFILYNKSRELTICKLVSRTLRAYYNPSRLPCKVTVSGNTIFDGEHPLPQFRIIHYPSDSPALLAYLAKLRLTPKFMPAYEMDIPRWPIQCPETTCAQNLFVSDFAKHLAMDHTLIPIERITPRRVKNFFIDLRIALTDEPKCHMIYLLRNKIDRLGHNLFGKYLPIMIMTARLNLMELMPNVIGASEEDDLQFLMVWVCGLTCEKYPLAVSLSSWARTPKYPRVHVCYSGQVYGLTGKQDKAKVYDSGKYLLITPLQQKILAGQGSSLLQMQFFAY